MCMEAEEVNYIYLKSIMRSLHVCEDAKILTYFENISTSQLNAADGLIMYRISVQIATRKRDVPKKGCRTFL